jgi:hypothetical protein
MSDPQFYVGQEIEWGDVAGVIIAAFPPQPTYNIACRDGTTRYGIEEKDLKLAESFRCSDSHVTVRTYRRYDYLTMKYENYNEINNFCPVCGEKLV